MITIGIHKFWLLQQEKIYWFCLDAATKATFTEEVWLGFNLKLE